VSAGWVGFCAAWRFMSRRRANSFGKERGK
jgi:hypothetical protein